MSALTECGGCGSRFPEKYTPQLCPYCLKRLRQPCGTTIGIDENAVRLFNKWLSEQPLPLSKYRT